MFERLGSSCGGILETLTEDGQSISTISTMPDGKPFDRENSDIGTGIL